ncbi:MAG: 4'-phosphopantetheinyl transferase superfamily protein [Cyclobacteriaceae bacterium]
MAIISPRKKKSILVGVDIVDHSDPLLRMRDERAFRLIRHPKDLNTSPPDDIEKNFWLFWAAKESVFKNHRELKRFDPKIIPIKINRQQGLYHFQSGQVKGTITQNHDFTFSICTALPSLDQTYYQYFNLLAQDQSLKIRELTSRYLKDTTNSEAKISRDDSGLPIAIINSRLHKLTFTHHHRYMGFICEK